MRRRRRRSGSAALAALLLAALLLAAPLPAIARADDAGTRTASAGQTSATLSWNAADYGVSGAHLTIARAGATLFDAAIPSVVCDGCQVLGDDAVLVRDLDADGEPEVLVRGFTGGAHCCTVLGIYALQGQTYAPLVRNYGSGGYRLVDRDHDGRPEIDSVDARFEYLFASYAASFRPPLILRYDHGRLTDVTRRYPKAVRAAAKEARSGLRYFERHRFGTEARGPLAAYVADEYLLGRGKVGLRELDRQARRGTIGTAKGVATFRARLLRLLHRFGYR